MGRCCQELTLQSFMNPLGSSSGVGHGLSNIYEPSIQFNRHLAISLCAPCCLVHVINEDVGLDARNKMHL